METELGNPRNGSRQIDMFILVFFSPCDMLIYLLNSTLLIVGQPNHKNQGDRKSAYTQGF